MFESKPELEFEAEDLSVDVFALVDEGLSVQPLTATTEAPARSCGGSWPNCIA